MGGRREKKEREGEGRVRERRGEGGERDKIEEKRKEEGREEERECFVFHGKIFFLFSFMEKFETFI